MAYSLQIATWKEQQQAAGDPIGPSLPPGLPPADASSPNAQGDTLQRGKLALGMQANGSPVDELRTEPAAATAHVLSDFTASGPAELSVSRGEFVTVLVGAGFEVPDGWCHCQVSREGQSLDEEGLVPWYHLVSVKDPEHQAVAQALQPGSPQQPGSPAGAKPVSSDGSPDGATERGSWHEMSVLRSGGGNGALGIDVNEVNCVCRISPGSAAALSGELQVG